jgi:2,3-bisphosphoglycerate-independent phosphoglycerate mutase
MRLGFEKQMRDDRLRILLVILDGLGDRACDTLEMRTPCEAANTPNLDALVRQGASGVHLPFGPGRATSSEHAHWSLFGFNSVPFPGRAAIEALGVGLKPPEREPMFHLALRAGIPRDGKLYLGARARPREDIGVAAALFDALAGRSHDGVSFELLPLRTGECVLITRGAGTRDVSDSDALFDHLHPWMRPRALPEARDAAAATRLAVLLEQWLLDSRRILDQHPLNRERRAAGLAPLDVAVTKWASMIDPAMPSFHAYTGLRGAAVTDTALYRGLARILEMTLVDIGYDATQPAVDMRKRIAAATTLLETHDFVHVHVKATDEAAHTKQPELKRAVIEATDAGLSALPDLARRAVVAVTGDHASPSVGSLLHSGDPTPLVVAAPGQRPDSVVSFGEQTVIRGDLGRLRADELLPLLAGLANRPFFLGHRPGAARTLALPDAPESMSPTVPKEPS